MKNRDEKGRLRSTGEMGGKIGTPQAVQFERNKKITLRSGFLFYMVIFILFYFIFKTYIPPNKALSYCGIFQAILLFVDLVAKKNSHKLCTFVASAAIFNLGMVIAVLILIVGKFTLFGEM